MNEKLQSNWDKYSKRKIIKNKFDTLTLKHKFKWKQ